jgi:type II secretory pathway pseudopilin PulG
VKRLLRAWWGVLLLSLVAVIAIPTFSGELDRNYTVEKTKQDIGAIEAALEQFKGRTGKYPTQEGGLATLVGTELLRLPVDSWGSRYSYSLDRTGKPFVYSNGANRRDEAGLADDIVSGEKTYRCEDYQAYCLRPTDIAERAALGLAIASLLVGVVRGVMRLWS